MFCLAKSFAFFNMIIICMTKNITNEQNFNGDLVGNVTGDLIGNITTNFVFEETANNGVNIDGIQLKDDCLFTAGGNIKLTENPSITGSEVYLTANTAGVKVGIESALSLSTTQFNLNTVGNGLVSTTGNLTLQSGTEDVIMESVNGNILIESPSGELLIDVSGNVDIECSNANINNASFGGLTSTIAGTIASITATNFNISSGTTTDFASGSTVDFTGANVTGLSSGGLNVDGGLVNISSTGNTGVSLAFEPKLIVFNWNSGTETGSSQGRSSIGYYCDDAMFLAYTFTNGSSQIQNSTETQYCYGISNLSDTILGNVIATDTSGFTMHTIVFSGYSSESFAWLALG